MIEKCKKSLSLVAFLASISGLNYAQGMEKNNVMDIEENLPSVKRNFDQICDKNQNYDDENINKKTKFSSLLKVAMDEFNADDAPKHAIVMDEINAEDAPKHDIMMVEINADKAPKHDVMVVENNADNAPNLVSNIHQINYPNNNILPVVYPSFPQSYYPQNLPPQNAQGFNSNNQQFYFPCYPYIGPYTGPYASPYAAPYSQGFNGLNPNTGPYSGPYTGPYAAPYSQGFNEQNLKSPVSSVSEKKASTLLNRKTDTSNVPKNKASTNEITTGVDKKEKNIQVIYWKDIMAYFKIEDWNDLSFNGKQQIRLNNRLSLKDDVSSVKGLKDFLYSILRDDNINCRLKEDKKSEHDIVKYYNNVKFRFPLKFFTDVIECVNILIGESNKNKESIEDFTYRIISLRILREIRNQKITIFDKAISPEKEKDGFEKLCQHAGKYQLLEKHSDLGPYIDSYSSIGEDCTHNIMDEHRFSIKKITSTSSPASLFNSFAYITQVATTVKGCINNKRACLLSDLLMGAKKKGATQFRPTYIKDLLSFLKGEIKITDPIEKICDLCSGWGDRLLGCLASVEDKKIKRYLATDPNEDLQDAYKSICKKYPPKGFIAANTNFKDVENGFICDYAQSTPEKSNFSVTIYKLPLENLTKEQLNPGGVLNDLVFTSIPYFNLEEYKGNNQAHIVYNEYDSWKKGFLESFVKQSVVALKEGGILAVNSAPITSKKLKYDITSDLKGILDNYKTDGITFKQKDCFLYNSGNNHEPSVTLIYQKTNKPVK